MSSSRFRTPCSRIRSSAAPTSSSSFLSSGFFSGGFFSSARRSWASGASAPTLRPAVIARNRLRSLDMGMLLARVVCGQESFYGRRHEQSDETRSLASAGGPPQGGRALADARPLPAGPAPLREILAAVQRHPLRFLQEPHHGQDAVTAAR